MANSSLSFLFDDGNASRPVEALSVAEDGAFSIPISLRDLKIADLPLSGRLKRVLDRLGAFSLGDIDGLSFKDMQCTRNCGPGTVLELAKFVENAAREKKVEPRVSSEPADLARMIDAMMEDLPGRDKDMLLSRFAGKGGKRLTLEAAGAKYKITRERVRQVINRCVEKIRRGGGWRLQASLAHIEEFCRNKVCPLTPALLKQWCENSRVTGRFDFGFYISVLREFEPAIPCWPAGHPPYIRPTRRNERVISGLETVLLTNASEMPLSMALVHLQKLEGLEHTQTPEFFAVLDYSNRFKVEFPQPDAPIVRLAWLSPVSMARAVLEESDKVLTLDEIIQCAQLKFGSQAVELKPRPLAYSLTEERGFYQLGRSAFGLRRHFSTPQRLWKPIQKDFRNLLKRENHPILASYVAGTKRFKWARQMNSYELAYILRKDHALIDLGRFLFALAEWKIEKREFIIDLITRVLKKAGRPLTTGELLRQLRQLRSISSGIIAKELRRHPRVGDFGDGHYGLKS